MATEPRSFEDLVKEAPLASGSDTVTLTGTLSRSPEANKFVLHLAEGQTITLETASVKEFAVLGTSVGHTIVKVEVERAQLPTPQSPAAGAHALGSALTIPDIDHIKLPIWDHTLAWLDHTLPWLDQHKHPPFDTVAVYDHTVFAADVPKAPWIDVYGTGLADVGPNTLVEGNPGGGWQAGMPFAMGAPHQVDPSVMAAMPGAAAWQRPWKRPITDGWKPPPADGTFPGHPHSDY